MENNIFKLLATLLQPAMLLIMYYNLTKKRIPWLVIALFPVVMIGSYALMNYFFFIPLLIYFYIIGQKYGPSSWGQLSWFFSVYTLFSYSIFSYSTQTLISLLFGDRFLNQYFYILNITVISIAPVILNYFILKILSPNLDFLREHIDYLYKPFFTFINISFTILCTVQFTSYWIETYLIKKDNPIRVYMLTFFLLLIFVLTKYLGNTVNAINTEEIQRLKDQQLLQMERYVNQIENTYDQLRYFRHDFKNILISMDESIKTNDIQIVRENYDKILKSQNIIMHSNNIALSFSKLNNIKNMPVKSILYAHLVSASQKGIDVNLEIEDSIINEPIDTFDYVRVLSVLLDNAIEEAEEYSNGAMNVYFIKDSSNNLTVIVENTFYGKYSNISELFQTSMSSKGHNRGLGLASVEIILNKYRNISLETEIKNDLFIQKIIMKW